MYWSCLGKTDSPRFCTLVLVKNYFLCLPFAENICIATHCARLEDCKRKDLTCSKFFKNIIHISGFPWCFHYSVPTFNNDI